MEDQIVAKLRRELERPIATEALVVYLLVEIRKLLDRQKLIYPTLRLCCDWAVHVELSRKQAAAIVKKVDELYPKILGGELTESDRAELRAFFTMDQFRKELEEVLTRNDLRRFGGDEWDRFMACYLKVIEDCPLVCKVPGLAYVDTVALIKELGSEDVSNLFDQPAIWWALYRGGARIFLMGATFERSEKALSEVIDSEAISQ
jgi:hypothetical protein